ncbi:hypothetical protein BD626DRAFT_507581 [Schizophyllum amplum]|uniref:Uncharacterized protein n=1 Tax=Schizophyllum amplum TaxID=97359 RepID=A0A550C488_9AGAR|nr:hypothetical protein BD626DRAFT_507581 [Auriculariopsis ampla]
MRSARQYIAWQEGRVMASVIAAGPEIESSGAYMDDVPMIEWKALGQSWPRSLLHMVPKELRRAVETGDLDGIALLLTHVDKAPRIKDTLCGISPFPDAGIPIVEELLGTSDESGAAIAVSGLQLTGAQLCLDLSGNAALDVDGLCDLLLTKRPQWASAFSIEAFAAGLPLPGCRCISVPMLSPAPLLRNITHFMKAVMEGGSELGAGVGDAALEADWASRSVWCTAAPMRQRDWLGTFDGKWRLAVFWTSQVTISDTLRDMGLLRGSDMASRAGRTVLAALTGDDPDRTTPKPPALFYGFLREQQRKGWLAYDKQWELLNARQFLQALREETSQPEEQQHAGILGYGTALFSYGRPPVPEDIQQEFLDVFDQVERKGGVMGSFRYAKMAVESAAQHGFRQALARVH